MTSIPPKSPHDSSQHRSPSDSSDSSSDEGPMFWGGDNDSEASSAPTSPTQSILLTATADATFPCSQKYYPRYWLRSGRREDVASWGARVGTHRWKQAEEIADFETMARVLPAAVLDAVLERMRDARDENSDETSRKKFREWHSMTNQFVIDAYEAALNRFPPPYKERAPAIAVAGRLCRTVMNHFWDHFLDSRYYPGNYNMYRPILLEDLGICDPLAAENLPLVRQWAMVAFGWKEPPPYERKPRKLPPIWIDEDEWDEKIAEWRAKGLLHE